MKPIENWNENIVELNESEFPAFLNSLHELLTITLRIYRFLHKHVYVLS